MQILGLKNFVLFSLVFLSACSTCQKQDSTDELLDTKLGRKSAVRRAGLISGSQFIRSTSYLSHPQREGRIQAELSAGNFPNFLRKLIPINVTERDKSGKLYRLTFWVSSDYFSIGDDKDYVRMPMNPHTAQALADQYGAILPTRKMVDLIYKNAAIKLNPKPKPPGPKMETNAYYLEHHMTIESQLRGKVKFGLAIAGHKKDVVISNRLLSQPGRVAIYGWHQTNTKAIQPLSLVHGDRYADYSHGVRLVRNLVMLNGKVKNISDVLKNPQTAFLLSDEGVMQTLGYRPQKLKISQNNNFDLF
ncbi:MAG: hypothetical protein KBD78_07280 [Oligoflexales bacterium]|nr:hypothetical protein [Oligoflexales bacterium]